KEPYAARETGASGAPVGSSQRISNRRRPAPSTTATHRHVGHSFSRIFQLPLVHLLFTFSQRSAGSPVEPRVRYRIVTGRIAVVLRPGEGRSDASGTLFFLMTT